MANEPDGPPEPDQSSPDNKTEPPETFPAQDVPARKTAPETDDDSGQADEDAQNPHDDDPSQHDDPYHHDYEHEDHDPSDAQHDEHHHHGHENHQEEDYFESSVSTPLPVPRSSGGSDGDDTMPELDEDGEGFGGPVKSFLEHMEDLRWVLIRCIAALGVSMVACLAGAPLLVETLARPLGEAREFLTKNRKENLSEEGKRSEERRVGKECRSRWSPYH